jgi:hypothetical protein
VIYLHEAGRQPLFGEARERIGVERLVEEATIVAKEARFQDEDLGQLRPLDVHAGSTLPASSIR